MSLDTLESAIQKLPKKFIIITYPPTWGGSILNRIISAHDECFTFSRMHLQQDDHDDPIQFPDSVEGFYYQTDHGLTFTEQHLACVHLGFGAPWDDKHEDSRHYIKAIKSNKIIVLRTHDVSKILDPRFHEVKFVNVVGKRVNRGLVTPNRLPQEIVQTNVLNFDISKLLNDDYDTFLESYLELATWLELTSRVNSVRAFILLWLEKQKRYKQFLANKLDFDLIHD